MSSAKSGLHLSGEEVRHQLARKLIAWHRRHGRDLPWQMSRDPYHILVSEIMLQQTQVERVQRYYQPFLNAFPDLVSLAQAPPDHVLKLWEGMGYYARARNLQRTAQAILREHGGRVPREVKVLMRLPGVGYNTAAAVASFAHDEPWPVLDGNAIRVLCRVFRARYDPRSATGHERLVELGKTLLPSKAIGRFNQALMDLGALICRPQRPRCDFCPLSELCLGCAYGDAQKYPQVKPRAHRPHYDITAGIIWKGQQLLIAQRPPGELLGGLWEFPGGKREDGESLPECLRREIKEELGIRIRVDGSFMSLEHGYSHFRFTLHAFHCTYLAGKPRPLGCADFRWVRVCDLNRFALPRADQKLAVALRERSIHR
jgi:A/G-specific adenine glycosylase